MLEFIVKYWLEVVFGLICLLVSWGFKKYYKYKQEQKIAKNEQFEQRMVAKFNEAIDTHDKKFSDADAKIKADMELLDIRIETMTEGLLSIQGRAFKKDCREMLEPNHIITVDEYEQLSKDHDVYNSLGGNHWGDSLFEAVKEKFYKQV